MKRCIVIVIDSVGCGEAPDASKYHDQGSNTLGHTASAVGGLHLPNMQKLGLGNLTEIQGVPADSHTTGAYGKMHEDSAGKDTETGHWEMGGLLVEKPFALYPDGFPDEIMVPFVERSGYGYLANKPASGTVILEELGEESLATGKLIVYTSGDSVFQIAANEEQVPVDELYRVCRIAREICDEHYVGRVIARPFVGTKKGEFQRTYNRKDFGMEPPGKTMLDLVTDTGQTVVGIGKIPDIYHGRGISEAIHSEGNLDGLRLTLEVLDRVDQGLIMTNLVDFDMLYGHRRDAKGYAQALVDFDNWIPSLLAKLNTDSDLVLVTADHGNDPTYTGTDHTREYVPLLAFGPPTAANVNLGTRSTMADLGRTVTDALGAEPPSHGTSFLPQLL